MVGHDAQRQVDLLVDAISLAAQALAHAHQATQDVGVEVGHDALHDAGDALQAHARVDVAVRERDHAAVFLTVELREHEVPVLEEAIAVAAGGAVRTAAAHLGALVVVHLGARAARAGGAGNPEVVVFAQTSDVVGRDADLLPDLCRLVVIGEHGDVDAVLLKLEDLGGELVRPGAHLLLEVLAKREVAEHLEERQMTPVGADDVDVVGADALLRGGGADIAVVQVLLLQEVRLELDHTGNRQQKRRVIGDQRGRRPALAALLLEELQVCLADFCGGCWYR